MNFVPHDRRANIYFSALDDAAACLDCSYGAHHSEILAMAQPYLEDLEKGDRTPDNVDEKLARLGMQLSHAVIEGRTTDADEIEANFKELAQSHPDPLFMKAVPSAIRSHSAPGYDYRNWKGTDKGLNFGKIMAQLEDDAVIGIIGDWGTGDNDAKALLQEMKSHYNPDVILHLGDIYRSCRYPQDVLTNFVNVIDSVYGTTNGIPNRPPILTIAGNHDYMSKGGKGFFKLLDTVNAHHPGWEQEASFFCLRNKSQTWQILGADTGINDPSFTNRNSHPGLEPDEYEWHYDKIDKFGSKGKGRTIFLTHHPLISATHAIDGQKHINKKLAKGFEGYLTGGTKQDGEIRLWLWGHNHWFIPYAQDVSINDSTLDKGRLLGGSARHDLHSTSEILNYENGKDVISENGSPLVPDTNNSLPNHTYAVLKLGVGTSNDAQIEYCQIPAWHYGSQNPISTLPPTQHPILRREWVLDSKPAQNYPAP